MHKAESWRYGRRWHPQAGMRRGVPEAGELRDRCRHLFSDYVLRRRKGEARVDDRTGSHQGV
ncbi:hypothetical protein GCM10010121_068880 [Streptomyces brasiliensis]|uniref:Uncharacterized protein n=1 Tax=Streptomyces brasiliensis TaxID=1954 RepID=A0A917P0F8_9ACTN|nr:hypothetical protein GCM10010121_068880 [Streptomyces brasiliensis]